MLGNIRFVGDLFKMKLMPLLVMENCISSILVVLDSDGQMVSWKDTVEESEIELLCHLLRSVGQILDQTMDIDLYFVRISELTKSKAVSSRLRFSLMEILELRKNKWIERHLQEKPQTLQQIHAQIQAESKTGGKIISRQQSGDTRSNNVQIKNIIKKLAGKSVVIMKPKRETVVTAIPTAPVEHDNMPSSSRSPSPVFEINDTLHGKIINIGFSSSWKRWSGYFRKD